MRWNISINEAHTSTPVMPPPATTKVNSCRRTSGSSAWSASSHISTTWARSRTASIRVLNGKALASAPGMLNQLVEAPAAITSWS